MKLTIAQVLNVESELLGLQKDGKEVFKGLLSQPLSLKTKFYLNRIAKKLAQEKETYVELMKAAVETGDEKHIEETHKTLLSSEVEVDLDLSQISIDDLDVETEFNYVNFLSLWN